MERMIYLGLKNKNSIKYKNSSVLSSVTVGAFYQLRGGCLKIEMVNWGATGDGSGLHSSPISKKGLS